MRPNSITSPEFRQRFFARMIRSASGCLEWQGSLTKGYGYVRCDGKNQYTHRVAWQIANGPIPSGICCLHHCDNPICCEPSHLFLGTNADNTHDMLDKGRDAHGVSQGEKNHAKLTDDLIIEIRTVYVHGSREFGLRALARRYGVTYPTIHKVVKQRSWTHI